MKMGNRAKVTLSALLLVVAVAIGGSILGTRPTDETGVVMVQLDATPAPTSPSGEDLSSPTPADDSSAATEEFPDHPIAGADDAIRRSEARLPAGTVVLDTVARLTTLEQFKLWSFNGIPTTTEQDLVWVVGLRVQGATVADLLPFYDLNIGINSVDGAYFAWSAATGSILEQGVLEAQGNQTLATAQGLPDRSERSP